MFVAPIRTNPSTPLVAVRQRFLCATKSLCHELRRPGCLDGKPMKREIAAYHEAGHVVAYTMLDEHAPKLATIIPSDGSARHVRSPRSRFAKIHNAYGGINPFDLQDAKAVAYAEIEMVCILAGQAAQKRFAPRSRHRQGAGSNGRDQLVAYGSGLQQIIKYLDSIWGGFSRSIPPKANGLPLSVSRRTREGVCR